MAVMSKHVQRHGHFIQNRKTEALIGFTIALIGMVLIWDAFDSRGKKLPWPVSGLTPW